MYEIKLQQGILFLRIRMLFSGLIHAVDHDFVHDGIKESV
ncbi:hypothetical protein NBRC111894_4305 [Sporolactobacillus inulinus]|uniref:Uncharacterized protein n=1 Tax=Sporolactobacillus inulinus TaxID=2078 RepID=A0A4Y1ZIF2_9BACL|nr:hypothetical protein NBRC111894_4305 [Sporolactobacillus inulinus]